MVVAAVAIQIDHVVSSYLSAGNFNNKNCVFDFQTRPNSKWGSFRSPNHPNHYPNPITCVYYFRSYPWERVVIEFVEFDLDFSHGDAFNPDKCDFADTLLIETQQQTMQQNSKQQQYNRIGIYCGKKLPPRTMSSGSNMRLTFTSGTFRFMNSRGFYAKYEFVNDFKVNSLPMVQDRNNECKFYYSSFQAEASTNIATISHSNNNQLSSYHSYYQQLQQQQSQLSSRNKGYFTSPNYPGLYPKNTTCFYYFRTDPLKAVVFNFKHFEVDDKSLTFEKNVSACNKKNKQA
ncbi:hypothetical protein HELRODRAFT_173504 [Helobdella robusta]|uniref:CUB domain-containing protein n=1 Tax=Helobdella robusta TaxID=6412 RepID=T1F6W7_HELRO|nr:hypothetical protein HELRODRAFT_173504 [Helobdella robusta]ESO03801.1 hypothetical protein HELRODRAFT_173504 [Helobdella robusta]